MSVNAIILLPPDVRVGDATNVIGILAGLPPEKQKLSGASYSCHVRGAKVEPSSIPEMANITLYGNLVDGETDHYTTWHWEPDCGTGKRLLYPKANTFWIAIGRKLVDFFGGSIVYCDCNGDTPDYRAKKPRKSNNPTNGLPWQIFQDEMLNLKPITQSDLDEANELSSYKATQSTTGAHT